MYVMWCTLSPPQMYHYKHTSITHPSITLTPLNPILNQNIHTDAQFTNTGLERGAALEQDITWMTTTFGVPRPTVDPEGPGNTYASLLRDLAVSDPPAFICHYYNIYFAHSAGGRMIGSKLSGMLLDGKELAFYQYQGDMKELLQVVRDNLNAVAESWSREEKDHCLEETEKSFKYSGSLMAALKG